VLSVPDILHVTAGWLRAVPVSGFLRSVPIYPGLSFGRHLGPAWTATPGMPVHLTQAYICVRSDLGWLVQVWK